MKEKALLFSDLRKHSYCLAFQDVVELSEIPKEKGFRVSLDVSPASQGRRRRGCIQHSAQRPCRQRHRREALAGKEVLGP